MASLNKYRILPDKGTDWPTSDRKIYSCVTCKKAVLAEADAFWVVNEYMDTAGTMRLTCSEECANMFILQNMDGKDRVIQDIYGNIL